MSSSRSTTLTSSSGSGERIERIHVVVPEVPVRSPDSFSTSASLSSLHDSDPWLTVPVDYDGESEILPDDSASYSRHSSARRQHADSQEPARRRSSRRTHTPHETEEHLPRRHSSHKHQSSRSHHRRRDSRRVPSDEASTVASHDDYPPYSHRGAPPPRAYPPPPAGGYRQMPGHGGYNPSVAGGYPPSTIASAGYPPDPFNAQAMIHMPQQDAFGYPPNPSMNPFTGAGSQSNPFSPMEAQTGGYFHPEHAPHMHHGQRPGPPGRHVSYGSTMYPGSEMIPHSQFQHPGMNPYGIPYPGMAPYGQMPYMLPPSQHGSPAPAPAPPAAPAAAENNDKKKEDDQKKEEEDKKRADERKKEDEAIAKELERLRKLEAEQLEREKAELKKKEQEAQEALLKSREDASLKQIEALKDLIKKHEEDRNAREAAAIAKAEADAAAVAAKKAQEEADKKKAEEIAAASTAAKEAAEKAAKEAADAAAAEHAKKLEEATKAAAEAEKKRKELEEAAEKAKPTPDSLKGPIKFKDAVGRKFSFPWHICKTWKGMETLIKQAFMHVDVIGQQVHEGHYDLTGPDGEIILPQVWDTMIQPDWEVTMHMWPMPEPEPAPPKKQKAQIPEGDPFALLNEQLNGLHMRPEGAAKPAKKKGDKKKKNAAHDVIIDVGPMDHGAPMAPPPMPGGNAFDGLDLGPPPRPNAQHKPRPKSNQPKKLSGLQAWMAGGAAPRPKKDDEKLELVRHHHKHVAHQASSPDQAGCTVM